MSQTIHCTLTEGLAHIEFCNPDRGNVLDLDTIDQFASAIEALSADQVRAVLISAQGKNFCIGGDLSAMAQTDDREALIQQMAGRLHEGIMTLNKIGVPVICAVNGAAAGAGLSLVASSDIVFGGENSSYVMAYTAIGLAADGGSSYYLPRVIGLRRTQAMAFLNKRLDAPTALDYGLITQIVSDDELQAAALKAAQRIAKGPTIAYRYIKNLYEQTYRTPLGEQLDAETIAISKSCASEDGGEGIASFLERRRPEFKGK